MKTIVLLAALVAALATAAIAAADSSAPPLDEQWLRTSISGDRFEIAGGKIALSRSSNAGVRAYAQRLIHDHTQSLQEAIATAQRWGIGVPPAATPSEQWELNRLRFMPKANFNGQYVSLEVKDHNQDIEETGEEAREGQAVDIRNLAMQDLPMLNMHLKIGKSLVARLNAKSGV
jgi:putative membrane protein